jgi:hypothetical protein
MLILPQTTKDVSMGKSTEQLRCADYSLRQFNNISNGNQRNRVLLLFTDAKFDK